jgi:branched-chain amino acid transport system ATP-binding protein
MALLKVERLVKDFDGLRANDHISFQVETGELVGIIGPNGAGKTTLFNCISGHYPVTSGRIIFDGKDITGLKAFEVARMGLARTFQVYAASGDLTVLENIMVGCFLRTRSPRSARIRAKEIARLLYLEEVSDSLVSELPVALQKRVSLGTALGTEPKLLLLDEVAAGLNPAEIDEMMTLIQRIHHNFDITVLLIEHVMKLVMNISQRVIVLDSGRKIAEGDPRSIAHDPNVIRAYLGERYARFLPKGESSGP